MCIRDSLEVLLSFPLHLSIECGTSHFTRKMADRRYKMAAIHHRLFWSSDVNASMPISTLSDRSADLSYIAVRPSRFGVSTVPFRRYRRYMEVQRFGGTERYNSEVQSGDEIGRYHAEVRDRSSAAGLLARGTDRYAVI